MPFLLSMGGAHKTASYAAQVEAFNELARRAEGRPQVGPIDKEITRLTLPAIGPLRKLGCDDTVQPVHDGLQNQLLPGLHRMRSTPSRHQVASRLADHELAPKEHPSSHLFGELIGLRKDK